MTSKCPSCNGFGGFDSLGSPCSAESIRKAMICELCDGTKRVLGQYEMCDYCEGMGGVDSCYNPCMRNHQNFNSKCLLCKGGYRRLESLLPIFSCMPLPVKFPISSSETQTISSPTHRFDHGTHIVC